MAGQASWLRKLLMRGVASQLEQPTKGPIGYFVTRSLAKRNAFLERSAVRLLDVQPDDRVLEIAYGPGVGLAAACERVAAGKGLVFGVEPSPYAAELAGRLCEAHVDADRLQLRLADVTMMPFVDDYFERVFHCNAYYFWDDLERACREIRRVMKPGGLMVTTLYLDGLKRMQRTGAMQKASWDPLPYMQALETVGFDDVHVEYVDYKAKLTYQAIYARKPLTDAQLHSDPDIEVNRLMEDVVDVWKQQRMTSEGRQVPDHNIRSDVNPDEVDFKKPV